jgi:hypothetical protein
MFVGHKFVVVVLRRWLGTNRLRHVSERIDDDFFELGIDAEGIAIDVGNHGFGFYVFEVFGEDRLGVLQLGFAGRIARGIVRLL